MTAPVEDTMVQIRDQKGDWVDYSRTTRAQALAAVEAGRLPGNHAPEPLRAVDWISKEEIAVTAKTEDTAATITAPEAAKKLGTEPKLFRRFLRSDASTVQPVGQGSRYAIDPKQLPALKKEFAAWQKSEAEKRAKREAAKAAKAESEPETESDEDTDEAPAEPRTEDVVDKVIAAGGLPKAEQVKATARKNRKAVSEAARKPETATA